MYSEQVDDILVYSSSSTPGLCHTSLQSPRPPVVSEPRSTAPTAYDADVPHGWDGQRERSTPSLQSGGLPAATAPCLVLHSDNLAQTTPDFRTNISASKTDGAPGTNCYVPSEQRAAADSIVTGYRTGLYRVEWDGWGRTDVE